LVENKYEGACTHVKSVCDKMDGFKVRVGVYQGSALSLYLFLVVMDAVTKEI